MIALSVLFTALATWGVGQVIDRRYHPDRVPPLLRTVPMMVMAALGIAVTLAPTVDGWSRPGTTAAVAGLVLARLRWGPSA